MEITNMSGRTIRAARAVLGWSTRKFAAEAGIGIATLNRFEREDGIYQRATVEKSNAIRQAIQKNLAAINWKVTADGGVVPMVVEE